MKRNLVAILRGVVPAEVEGHAETLIAAGVTTIEVPLNSPDPFESVGRLVARFGDQRVDRARVGRRRLPVPGQDLVEVGGHGSRVPSRGCAVGSIDQKPSCSARCGISSSIGTRTCSIESRSRMVTARSSSESKSTVTHSGVPISS